MKKLLFVVNGLGIGGIEKSLITLLKRIDYSCYSADLLVLQNERELINEISENVNILEKSRYVLTIEDDIIGMLKNANIYRLVMYCLYRVIHKFGKKPWMVFKKLDKEYDVVFSYGTNGNVPYYVIDKIEAKKKVLWQHHGKYQSIKSWKFDFDYFSKFETIICTSEHSKKDFADNFPSLNNKLVVITPLMDIDDIVKKSEIFCFDVNKRVLNIVSVARMAVEKDPFLAIEAMKILKSRKINFAWYWCGDGPSMDKVKKEINRSGLEEDFIILGNCLNPYPYIRQSDVFVQTSVFEAYSISIREARLLAKPVVSTKVADLDKIYSKSDGIFLCDHDPQSIAAAIEYIANNKIDIDQCDAYNEISLNNCKSYNKFLEVLNSDGR